MNLNELRDKARATSSAHGFNSATVGEDFALMHSEISEALEDHRNHLHPTHVYYLDKETGERHPKQHWDDEGKPKFKPCGIPSEMADVIIRVLDFCGKYGIDIQTAVAEKMAYNETRPIKHGGKAI